MPTIELWCQRLEIIITTTDDPVMYMAQWSMVRTFAWRPDKMIFVEYNCEQWASSPDNVAGFGRFEECVINKIRSGVAA